MTEQGTTYFDSVVVFNDDIQSLSPGRLLRTNIVAYCLAGLERQKNVLTQGGSTSTSSSITSTSSSTFLALDPSIAQCIFCFKDANLGPVDDMKKAMVMLIPIADYTSQTGDGGHWSLLLLFRSATTASGWRAVHCDSMGDLNRKRAHEMLTSMESFLLDMSGVNEGSCSILDDFTVAPNFPQQPNAFDCGIFLVSAATDVWTWCCEIGAPVWNTSAIAHVETILLRQMGIESSSSQQSDENFTSNQPTVQQHSPRKKLEPAWRFTLSQRGLSLPSHEDDVLPDGPSALLNEKKAYFADIVRSRLQTRLAKRRETKK